MVRWNGFALLPALVIFWATPGAASAGEERLPTSWQECAGTRGDAARLRCFDAWSKAQAAKAAVAASAPAPSPQAAQLQAEAENIAESRLPDNNCHEAGVSVLARFWELEYVDGKDSSKRCGLFGLRSGLRPMSIAATRSDSVNFQPTSGNPLNNAASATPYLKSDLRIQLSVRTKIWQGFAVREGPMRDSLWFGYTQQSYWQVFTGALSRPFRSTDHEPELMYVYPLASGPGDRLKFRYAGLGVVHQSNGQSLPLSRSWNRIYLMGGLDYKTMSLQGRVWQRIHESAASDDNPGISDYVGRAELVGTYDFGHNLTERLMVTLRSNLRASGRGSQRVEWLHEFDKWQYWGSLRFHTSLFTGYGDTLLDFNRRRTTLGLGVSLLDW